MITRERDADAAAKQDPGSNARSEEKTATTSKASSSSAASSSSSWSRLKDPRIVRVSRAFGGKDRHSKVCTVRGLRDRRVRLSVPTAIQLYDLQDRLGLNQPSKVVDWLLNAAKHEIDELPPLQMPPGGNYFNHNDNNNNIQSAAVLSAASHHHHHQLQSSKEGAAGGLRIGTTSINWDDDHRAEPPGSNTWHPDALFRPKSKEVARGDSSEDKEAWMKDEEIRNKQPSHFETNSISPPGGAYFSSNNFFSRLDHNSSSPTLGFLNSSMPPYNSLIRWDPSNLSLSQSGGLTSQHHDDFHNFGLVPLPPPPPPPEPQVPVYHQPPGRGAAAATQSYFPPHIAPEYGSVGGSRLFHLLGTSAKLLPSQDDDGQDKHDEDNGFRSR